MKNHTKKIFISYYYSEFCERTIFMVLSKRISKKKKETFVDKTKRKLSKLSLKMKSNIFLLLYNASNMFMNQNYCSNEVKKI